MEREVKNRALWEKYNKEARPALDCSAIEEEEEEEEDCPLQSLYIDTSASPTSRSISVTPVLWCYATPHVIHTVSSWYTRIFIPVTNLAFISYYSLRKEFLLFLVLFCRSLHTGSWFSFWLSVATGVKVLQQSNSWLNLHLHIPNNQWILIHVYHPVKAYILVSLVDRYFVEIIVMSRRQRIATHWQLGESWGQPYIYVTSTLRLQTFRHLIFVVPTSWP